MKRVSVAALALLLGCGEDGSGGTRIEPGREADAAVADGALTVALGAACAGDGDCGEHTCDRDWPDGYCTQRGCVEDGCADGACLDDGAGGRCVAPCGPDDACRPGYACARVGAGQGCVPAEPAEARWDGSACTRDADCAGGTCRQAPEWPDGLCTTSDCATAADCAGHAATACFISVREANFCVRTCARDVDCRHGYTCQEMSGGLACLPDPTPPVIRPEHLAEHPLDVVCAPVEGAEHRFGYTVGADAFSYLVVPLSPDGAALRPKAIELPRGAPLDLTGSNAFQATTALLHPYVSPTVVPGTDNFMRHLQAGEHAYVLAPRGPEVCGYVIETGGPGRRIDLNFYFVGTALTAGTARDNFDFNDMLRRFGLTWEKMGVAVGEVRLFDVDADTAERYAVLRSDRHMGALIEKTVLPGPTLDEALSVNVMLVQSFAVPRRPLLGSSEGLPGPAGLHGTRTSGVVMTAEFLGNTFRTDRGFVNGNEFTGDTLAHEVGHYLGLLHTTEQTQAHFDPLADTPACQEGIRFPDDCPDLTNLMFPFAGQHVPEVTAGQGWMVRANPLTRE